jgi:3',5'-cyclic AMP phosphodiesterase CpdA
VRIGHLTDLHLDGSADRAGRLARALQQARAWRCDHLCITGDLTRDGTDAQLNELGDLLRARWAPAQPRPAMYVPLTVTVVPGNHDAAAPVDWWLGTRRLRALSPFLNEAKIEFLRERPEVHLLALDTRMPRAQPLALRARGRVGEAQLRMVRGAGQRAAAFGAPLVVVMHHGPQVSPLQALDGLTDKEAFLRALEHAPTATVLAGHDHRCLDLMNNRLYVAPAVVDTDEPLRVYEVRGTRLVSVKACSAGRYLGHLEA